MFVTVIDEAEGTSDVAVLVSEDNETNTATLCVFYPLEMTYLFNIPPKAHAYRDEDGNYLFPYYEPEQTAQPTVSEVPAAEEETIPSY